MARRWPTGDGMGMETHDAVIRSQADIVGAIPHILGYEPEDSLVLAAVVGTTGRSRLGPVMRLDMDFVQADRIRGRDYGRIVELLESGPDIVEVIPVLFSEDVARAYGGDDGPLESPRLFAHFARPIQGLCDELVRSGYEVYSPLWVGAEHIGSLLPPGILQTRQAARSSTAATEMIVRGSQAGRTFDDVVALPPPDPDLLEDLAHWRAVRPEPPELLEALVAQLGRLATALAKGGEVREPTGFVSAQVVLAVEWMVSTKVTRDGLEMLLCLDHPDLPVQELVGLDGVELLARGLPVFASHTAAAHLPGLSARKPDAVRLSAAVEILRTVLVHCRESAVPRVLGVIAWFEWARGAGSFADHYAALALRADPGESLARLVSTAVQAGLSPCWMSPGKWNRRI